MQWFLPILRGSLFETCPSGAGVDCFEMDQEGKENCISMYFNLESFGKDKVGTSLRHSLEPCRQ